MAMAEMNLNWGKLARDNTLPQISKKWFERSKTVVAYNQHEKRKFFKHQPGGTAIISRGEVSLRVSKVQYDESRMGRWSSQVLEGKRGVCTRVVSVYVPVITSDHGHKKVACQQQRALLSMGIKTNVIAKFWEDFWLQIDAWIEAGEQLIIGGDWNRNVTKERWLDPFKKRNLIPAMVSRHGQSLPETHNNGTVPIDEIFYSSTLKVLKAGYLEHGSSLSDHRPIWVDFAKSTLIGFKVPLKPTYAARRLKTQDPRIVARYKKRLNEELERHHILYRTELLIASIKDNELTPNQIKEYETIDKIKVLAMKIAEKECRKLKMGEVAWTPEIQKYRRRIEYLTLSLRRKKGRKVHAITLIRTSKKASMQVENNSIKQIEEALKSEYKAYRKLKKTCINDRTSYLNSLAEALEQAGKGSKSKIIKKLNATEKSRSMFRKLAHINNKVHDLSTKSVTVKTPSGDKVITQKEELEQVIMDSNRAKYHQTEATCPFMKDPLLNDFGELGIGPQTTNALKGQYAPSEKLSPQTRDYIELCRLPQEEFVINPLTRSFAYFTKSWQKMKEKTSSRDLHFGHYKAVTDDNDLMYLHYRLAEIPFRTGYSPQRWKAATNVMILKKQGNTNIDKLRTLVLFESDFNHNNKFLGRSMMQHMVEKGFIAEEQYSTTGKKCIDHVLNRHLYFDNIRYKKTSGAMSAVDLKSCYDRVSHAPATLAMCSYGICPDPIISMFKTIQHMKYYTFTAHGMSKDYFGGKEKGFRAAPNGLGQGSGCAPTAWSIVSSKMFEVMHKRGVSTKISSPLTNTEIDVCGFAYVDDTDLVAMSNNVNDITDAHKRMQKTVEEWEAVSKVTGGALVPSKCWSWIIGFEWKQDNWSYKKVSVQDSIKVKDEHGIEHHMTMLEAHEAREMLGVSLAPDGNCNTQLEQLKEKMKTYAEYARTGHLNRHEAWVNLTMVVMKSLEYLLPALTLNKDQYTSIMAPVLRQFLPKLGLNRNIARDLLYAPQQIQGMDLNNPYILQGINHVCDISDHLWKDDMTGKLFRCNLEQLRIEIGDNKPILSSKIDKYQHYLLTPSLVRNTWEFMSSKNITLDDDTATIPLLREHDKCLMSEFANNPTIHPATLATLNRCRLYLKAFTLSDLVTGSGKQIRDEAWHGRQYKNGRENDDWPVWGRPGLQAWALWRSALKKTFCRYKNKMLDKPLGCWTTLPPQWEWFSATTDDGVQLIKKTKQGYRYYKRSGRSRLHKRYEMRFRVLKNVQHLRLLPTTIKRVHKYYVMDQPMEVLAHQDHDKNQSKDRTEWLYIDPFISGSERRLAESITAGTAIAVSDGSYSEDKGVGTASWTLSTQDKTHLVTAGATSPGPIECQSSYRSEILGLLGILEELNDRCKRWNIKNGKCTIFCDGISALHIIEDVSMITASIRYKCADLISACAKLKSMIPIKLEFIHVKGHQDDLTHTDQLSTPAQLNILMDTLAKNLLSSITPEVALHHLPHKYSFKAPVHTTIIRQQYKDSLYLSIMSKKGLDYWVKRKRLDEEKITLISWDATKQAQKSFNRTRLRTISKWCSDWIGTGKNMKRWNLRFNSNCALCGQDDEDTQHVLTCPHTLSIQHWDKQLREYDMKLKKFKTNYYLRKAIILDLEAWRKQRVLPTLQYADSDLRAVILQQRRVGWRLFLEGLMVSSMITYQHKYLQTRDGNKKGITWSKRVIKASWTMLLSIWDFRNEKTHQKDNIETLQGVEHLDEAIDFEWKRGLHRLPALEFSQFFRIKRAKLIKKSTEWKKDWLLTVKLGRSIYNDESQLKNEFDTNPALREWIGLPKSATQREKCSINNI